jgi:O-Antigen ligase
MSARSPMKHALAVAVAVSYVVVALPDGSYAPEAIAAGTLVIWWAVIVGLAVGAWPRAGVPRGAIAAGACIAALAVLTALSLAWANDDGRAFVEVVRVAGYAGVFALVVLASPLGSARSWLVGLAIGLVAVAALALGSRFEPGLPGGDDVIGAEIPSARGRLSFPIGYWNGLGACMALAGVLLVWLGARAGTRVGRSLAVAALPAILLTIYLTSSRGAMIAGTVGVAVLLALGPARVRLAGGLVAAAIGGGALIALTEQRSPLIDDPGTPVAGFAGDEILLATVIVVAAAGLVRYLVDDRLARLRIGWRVPRVALVVAGVLAIGALIAADPVARFEEFKSPPEGERLQEFSVSGDLTRGASSGRYQFWAAGADAFAEEPITGIGAGGYEAWWSQHGELSVVIRNAHSLFFETLSELGIAGLLLVLAFLALGAVHGWRRRGSGGSTAGAVEAGLAVLAAGIVSAAIDWTWEIPAVFGPVVVAVALLTGSASVDPANPVPIRRSFGWGIATLLAGWAAVWVAGVLFLAELKLSDSKAAADRGDLTRAAQDARDASTLQPWAAEPYLQLALVDEQAGNLPGARREIDGAIERAPDDWSLWFVASRIEEAAGDAAAALTDYGRARQLNPRTPAFRRR